MTTAAEVITHAQSQLGTAESPPNSNHVKYWDEIGMTSYQGQPWCGAFVTWLFKDTPLAGDVHFVYCPTGKQAFAQRGQLHNTPQPGDIAFYEWEHDTLVDHTGIVESVGDGFIVAIEGNTTAAGNYSDGGAVLRRTRDKSVWAGFGRPAYQQEDDVTEQDKQDIIGAVLAGVKALTGPLESHVESMGHDNFRIKEALGLPDKDDGQPVVNLKTEIEAIKTKVGA